MDAAFQAIDATAAAIPAPRPGRRVPEDLAYLPKGLPPAAALLSLTQMADPECKTNLRAQRSFTQVTQLGSWLELMVSAAGLGGEVRGTKVALRECSRLNGVARRWTSSNSDKNLRQEVQRRRCARRRTAPRAVGPSRGLQS